MGAILGGVIGGSAITLLVWNIVRHCVARRQKKKVTFALGKVAEIEDGEELRERSTFTFRPPQTPGQPITPGVQAPRTEFPFPLHKEAQAGTFKGPTERTQITVVTVFDPPPRVPVGEGKGGKKGGRRR